MTANQMQKEIDELTEAGDLSDGAMRRLRDLRNAVNHQREREQRKAAAMATIEPVERTAHQPADNGLEGAAWLSFFSRYCDPKGLTNSPLPVEPKREMRDPRAVPGTFNFSNRRVIINADIKPGRAYKTNIVIPTFTVEVDKKVKRAKIEDWIAEPTKGSRTMTNVIPGYTFGLDKALEFIAAQDENRLVQTYGEKRAARLARKLPGIRAAVEQVQQAA